MKSLRNFLNSLPFCGKIPARALAMAVFCSTDRKSRLENYFCLLGLMLFMISCHAMQIGLGVSAIQSGAHITAMTLYVVYILANCAAIACEISVSLRATRLLQSSRFPKRRHKAKQLPTGWVLTAFGVTIAGQLVFMIISQHCRQ